MQTLALVQGDLVPAPGGYRMYSGAQKISQDLSLALREEYGGDQYHPKWGSILPTMIGGPLDTQAKTDIMAEVSRVLANYIAVQNARIVQDNARGVLSSLTTDDVVQSVGSTRVTPIYDSVAVNVVLNTLSRQSVNINQIIS